MTTSSNFYLPDEAVRATLDNPKSRDFNTDYWDWLWQRTASEELRAKIEDRMMSAYHREEGEYI